MAPLAIEVSWENLARVCRLKDALRVPDGPLATLEAARAGPVALLVPLAERQFRDRPPGAAVRRWTEFPGRRRSSRAEPSACSFAPPVLVT